MSCANKNKLQLMDFSSMAKPQKEHRSKKMALPFGKWVEQCQRMQNKLFNPILHGVGGGAQSARANLKDSYLRNEYCYSNEIW